MNLVFREYEVVDRSALTSRAEREEIQLTISAFP